jgi:hypothetical protein
MIGNIVLDTHTHITHKNINRVFFLFHKTNMSSSSSSNTNEQTEKNIPIVSTNTNINLKELYERPAQELCRAKVILHCRDEFQKLCHQFFPWINHIPVEILDRWIFL